MKCPVCKIDLEFPISNMEEAYYDCSNCGSSLLFKKGECEVLSEGKAPDTLKQTRVKQSSESQETARKKQTAESSRTIEKLSENVLMEEGVKQWEDEKLHEENQREEVFSTNEGTQVPELSRFEEELSQSAIKQEKKPEDHLNGDQSDSRENKETNNKLSSQEKDSPFDQEKEQEEVSLLEQSLSGPEKKQASEKTENEEDFSEVADFGNTQDQDRQGPFLYSLILSEINSQNIREKILSIVENECLNLPDKDKLINNNIKDGKLSISKISPIQTYMIVTALMGLPINISWKQRHIADSSSKN